MRIFLDADCLFSAAKTDGALRRLVEMPIDQGHECWCDDYVVAEARRNLATKGRSALGMLDELLAAIHTAPGATNDPADEDTAWLPEKDRPVLAAAIRLGCDALVTGDRAHFGPGYGRRYGSVVIHSPRSLAEYLWEARRE